MIPYVRCRWCGGKVQFVDAVVGKGADRHPTRITIDAQPYGRSGRVVRSPDGGWRVLRRTQSPNLAADTYRIHGARECAGIGGWPPDVGLCWDRRLGAEIADAFDRIFEEEPA